METSLLISLLIILTIASAYFSGSETALFSLSPMKIKAYTTDPDPKKQLIAKLLQQPRQLLVTVFMLNSLANILLQNTTSSLFGEDGGWAFKIGIPLFITLFIGEIIPKNICMQHNVAVSYKVINSLNFFHQLLGRIRGWTIAITHPISRILFFFLKKEEDISKEELHHVLKTSEESGLLHPDESQLIEGYLKLKETTVKELMTPNEDVIFYKTSDPLTKLVHLFVDEECTRIPVCQDDIEHVLGIITAKEYFLHADKFSESKDLKPFLKQPYFVPETTSARSLLEQFDQRNQVFGVVVDEYGSISGTVTREDIVELVIGDIKDRRDQTELYSIAGENEIIASGKLELSEFNRFFNSQLTSQMNMVTIGGWLIEKIGDIPKEGTTYQTKKFLFKILASDPNRIRRIYVSKLANHKGKK